MSYFEITFFVVVLIQVVYFLFFLLAFARKRGQLSTSTANTPISIIVCAHDELPNLREMIPQLLAQDHPNFEVVVVDDRSNDATLDWLLTETKNDHRLRMVHVNRVPEHVNGKKYGLTLGIRAALHEWLVFTDADCRPASTQWLNGISQNLNGQTQFVLGYSPYQKQGGWLNRFIRFEALITAVQYIGFALHRIPYMGVGRNMAYRKSLFMDSKGFNAILSVTGGDDDLYVNQHANKTNTEIALGKETLVYSIPKTTLRDFLIQKIRHLAAGKKYKWKHRILLAIFIGSWIFTILIGIPLLFLSNIVWMVAAALVLRVILAITTLHIAGKRLGDFFESWSFALLDIIYSIYYLTTGTVALVTKKIRWKN